MAGKTQPGLKPHRAQKIEEDEQGKPGKSQHTPAHKQDREQYKMAEEPSGPDEMVGH
jgi:hypothetical protein